MDYSPGNAFASSKRTSPASTNQNANVESIGMVTKNPIKPSTPKTREIQNVIFFGGVSFISQPPKIY